ncbi:MAG: hypothetical protein KJ069_02310 [Anaerolineae bacterium]|nr:hypothetical protein [Anaerolineae bacterium]
MLEKVQLIWKPKVWLMMAAMMLLLGVVGSVAAATEVQSSIQGAQEHTRGLSPEIMASVIIMHYGPNGNPTGRLHNLTIDEYYAIIDALLASGHSLSPQNVDCMGHRMRGEDCNLWP